MEKTGYSDVDSLLRYLNDMPNDDHDILRLGDEGPINEKENYLYLLTEEELKGLIYLNSFA